MEAARHLPQVLAQRVFRPPALTFAGIHSIMGEPPAARAALQAARATPRPSWSAVGAAYRVARTSSGLASSDSAWNGYRRVCETDGVDPLPVTLPKLLACWSERVIGRGLKSSALRSITSRITTHAALAGSPVPQALAADIGRDLRQFRETFPNEVRSLAPPLGAADGLDVAIAYADTRAGSSLFYRIMSALLHVSKALYCRPSALLNGRLRRRHISYLPPTATTRGGLVINLILPKKRKDRVDLRLDSHPIPTGPAVLALVSLLDALGLLAHDAPADGIVFPDVDPAANALRSPLTGLPVRRATDLMREHVYVPAGLKGGSLFSLRSIRSGASTDAAIAGVTRADRLAQGGWATAEGAATYLDSCLVVLSGAPARS